MPSFTGEQETTHINEQNKCGDSNSPTFKFPEIKKNNNISQYSSLSLVSSKCDGGDNSETFFL